MTQDIGLVLPRAGLQESVKAVGIRRATFATFSKR